MAETPTPAQYVDRAQALLQDRLDVVQDLVQTRLAVEAAQAALAEAQRADAVAYAAATRKGWTEQELGLVGIAPPAVRVPGRPRSRGSRARGGQQGQEQQQE